MVLEAQDDSRIRKIPLFAMRLPSPAEVVYAVCLVAGGLCVGFGACWMLYVQPLIIESGQCCACSPSPPPMEPPPPPEVSAPAPAVAREASTPPPEQGLRDSDLIDLLRQLYDETVRSDGFGAEAPTDILRRFDELHERTAAR